MLFICIFIISVTWLIPHQILSILGKNYKNLDIHLLFLAICGSCMNLLGGSFPCLIYKKRLGINPVLSISIIIIDTIIAFFYLIFLLLKGFYR